MSFAAWVMGLLEVLICLVGYGGIKGTLYIRVVLPLCSKMMATFHDSVFVILSTSTFIW